MTTEHIKPEFKDIDGLPEDVVASYIRAASQLIELVNTNVKEVNIIRSWNSLGLLDPARDASTARLAHLINMSNWFLGVRSTIVAVASPGTSGESAPTNDYFYAENSDCPTRPGGKAQKDVSSVVAPPSYSLIGREAGPEETSKGPDDDFSKDWMMHIAFNGGYKLAKDRVVTANDILNNDQRGFILRLKASLDALAFAIKTSNLAASGKYEEPYQLTEMIKEAVLNVAKLVIATNRDKIKKRLHRQFAFNISEEGDEANIASFYGLFTKNYGPKSTLSPQQKPKKEDILIGAEDLDTVDNSNRRRPPFILDQHSSEGPTSLVLEALKDNPEGWLIETYEHIERVKLSANDSNLVPNAGGKDEEQSRPDSGFGDMPVPFMPVYVKNRLLSPSKFHEFIGRQLQSLDRGLADLERLMSLSTPEYEPPVKGKPKKRKGTEDQYDWNNLRVYVIDTPLFDSEGAKNYFAIDVNLDSKDPLHAKIASRRKSAIDLCLVLIIRNMTFLDKLANYSATFYAHVNGRAFDAVRNRIDFYSEPQSSAEGKSEEDSLFEPVPEIHDPYREWMKSIGQWLHVFQRLMSKEDEQRMPLLKMFENATKFVEVKASTSPYPLASLDDLLYLSGVEKRDFWLNKLSSAHKWLKPVNWDNQPRKARVHCECVIILEMAANVAAQASPTEHLRRTLSDSTDREIGVSKKCCVLCAQWIEEFSKQLIGKPEGAKGPPKLYANSHGRIFAWSPPQWDSGSAVVNLARDTASKEVLKSLCGNVNTMVSNFKHIIGYSRSRLGDTGSSGGEKNLVPDSMPNLNSFVSFS